MSQQTLFYSFLISNSQEEIEPIICHGGVPCRLWHEYIMFIVQLSQKERIKFT